MKERKAPGGRQKNILFISHEMSQTGAPRSLLLMCRIARERGHVPWVWTLRGGPLEAEFAARNIPVETVTAAQAEERRGELERFDLAVCNTGVTAHLARLCCQRIPTVWYIHEAANIADVLRTGPPETAYILRHSRDIVCVSDYAAAALAPYLGHPPAVVCNAVEDEAEKVRCRAPGSGEGLRFLQLGTLERRKGCDVLLEAFAALPPELRAGAELCLAGPGSESPYGAALLEKAAKTPGVRYLGVLAGEERLRVMAGTDVVVSASRDDACGLTVLEGAMLGKALIVTENVGAKYMVGPRNGFVTAPGDPASLGEALARCLREKHALAAMGFESRRRYESLANMEEYTRSLCALFARGDKRHSAAFRWERRRNALTFRLMQRLSAPPALPAESGGE